MTTAVRALGEVALRVNDLATSESFYRDVIGLQLMKRFDHAAFFRIADGFVGHTTVLALFDRSGPVEPTRTTVDHIAFTIALEDRESEKRRLAGLGISVTTATHEWARWRSLYLQDPDGNQVELVCFDPEA